jgi:hypothetical protein
MKRSMRTAIVIMLGFIPSAALAESRTVTLSVSGMT